MQPGIKELAPSQKPRRSKRLNFAKLVEIVFETDSDGDLATVQMNDVYFTLWESRVDRRSILERSSILKRSSPGRWVQSIK